LLGSAFSSALLNHPSGKLPLRSTAARLRVDRADPASQLYTWLFDPSHERKRAVRPGRVLHVGIRLVGARHAVAALSDGAPNGPFVTNTIAGPWWADGALPLVVRGFAAVGAATGAAYGGARIRRSASACLVAGRIGTMAVFGVYTNLFTDHPDWVVVLPGARGGRVAGVLRGEAR